MTSFKNFLSSEPANLKSQIDIIKRDCSKWLKEAGGGFAWRGINPDNNFFKKLGPDFYIASVRKDRKPKDSPDWLHDLLNRYFISKTGIPVRSASMFCIGDKSLAGNYGHRGIVFPIGEFHYTWSKYVADATHTFFIGPDTEGHLPTAGRGLNSMIEKEFKKYCQKNAIHEYDSVQDYIDRAYEDDVNFSSADTLWANFCSYFISIKDLWEFDTGLRSALTFPSYSEHELMVVCDKYYIILEGEHYPLDTSIRKLIKKD